MLFQIFTSGSKPTQGHYRQFDRFHFQFGQRSFFGYGNEIYLVLCVVWGLVVITGGSLSVLNDTVMSGSLYYKVFNLFNPFL